MINRHRGETALMVEGEALFPIVGAATIPGMIGVAFIILSFFNPNKHPPEV